MKKNEIKKITFIFILICLCYILFESNTLGVHLDRFSMVFFMGLSVFSGYFFSSYTEEFKEKYIRKKSWIFIFIIALIMAFIIAGQPLFLNAVRIYIDLKRLLFYGLLVIWCIPVELFILYLLEIFSLKISLKKIQKNEINKRKVFWTCFIIFMIIWTLSFIGMFPGTMTSDSLDQYLQALGIRNFSNAHPVLMTLFIKASLIISKSPSFFIYLQIIFFSLILSQILSFLYEHGLSKKFIYIFSFIFAIMPSNYLLIVSLWKDIIFTISLLWMTYLILKLSLNEKDFFKDKKNSIFFIIATICTTFFRHNGIGPFVFIIIYFIYKIFTTKKKAYIFLTVILITCYVGINKSIQYLCQNSNSSNYPSYSLINNLLTRSSGQILQTTTLPEYTEEVITRYGSIELLKKLYNPYNVDTYGFNDDLETYRKQLGSKAVITTSETLASYSQNFIHHPLDTIKERLDGTDILWNMKQPQMGYNDRYAVGLWTPNKLNSKEKNALSQNISSHLSKKDSYVPNNIIFRTYINFVYKFENCFILDNIAFRGGIYLILLFIAALFLWKNNRKLYPIYLPMMGNTATWILLLAYQTYRYIWYMEVITIFIILFTIVFGRVKMKKYESFIKKFKRK